MPINQKSLEITKQICEQIQADWPKTRAGLLRSGNFKAALDLDPERINFKTTLKLIARGLIRGQDVALWGRATSEPV